MYSWQPPPLLRHACVPAQGFNVSTYNYWFENQPNGLEVQPLTGAACSAGADTCVGTLGDGSCVCYAL